VRVPPLFKGTPRAVPDTRDAVYSAYSPSSKPYFAASTSWRLTLVLGDDWGVASAAVTNESLKALRKMNRSFELLCHFFSLDSCL
jgi:hypothetical protein